MIGFNKTPDPFHVRLEIMAVRIVLSQLTLVDGAIADLVLVRSRAFLTEGKIRTNKEQHSNAPRGFDDQCSQNSRSDVTAGCSRGD